MRSVWPFPNPDVKSPLAWLLAACESKSHISPFLINQSALESLLFCLAVKFKYFILGYLPRLVRVRSA